MKEFMLIIRNQPDHDSAWSKEKHFQFLRSCENYIGELRKEGKLITAQPLIRDGKIVSGDKGNWQAVPYDETGEVQVGYYHIMAHDLDEAVEIAKRNPEFEFGTMARIEVRQIKTMEDSTGFVYP